MRYVLICLLFLPAAVAQPGADPWSGLRAKNPPGIEVSLRLLREGGYREGELIRAEVHYPGRSVPPPQGPPADLWTPNGFLLAPAAACGTLASPCFPFFGVGGGISTSGLIPNSPLISLNGHLRTPKPGRYRVAALARKQVLINREPGTLASPCFPFFGVGGGISTSGLIPNSPLISLNGHLRTPKSAK